MIVACEGRMLVGQTRNPVQQMSSQETSTEEGVRRQGCGRTQRACCQPHQSRPRLLRKLSQQGQVRWSDRHSRSNNTCHSCRCLLSRELYRTPSYWTGPRTEPVDCSPVVGGQWWTQGGGGLLCRGEEGCLCRTKDRGGRQVHRLPDPKFFILLYAKFFILLYGFFHQQSRPFLRSWQLGICGSWRRLLAFTHAFHPS